MEQPRDGGFWPQGTQRDGMAMNCSRRRIERLDYRHDSDLCGLCDPCGSILGVVLRVTHPAMDDQDFSHKERKEHKEEDTDERHQFAL
ncbi:MAG TPA: hypothetical protein VGA56_03195 [Opitutaceae bacterium]